MRASKKKQNLLNQELLRELLHYNPESGIFMWVKPLARCKKPGDIAGSINKLTGYIDMTVNGNSYLAHRLAWLYMTGNWPENDIDHINRIKDDNRFSNLRDVTHKENMQNFSLRKGNKSGLNGVSWDNNIEKWRARITISWKSISLGNHPDIFEAFCARKSAESKYFIRREVPAWSKGLELTWPSSRK